ncbi:MAG TPA: hypothetical protein VLX89_08135 [Actinomycetota bacterium]|nr:hypothetical protein [Actinomycetota bacterium]
MPEVRDVLERQMDRTPIEPITVEAFFRRRDSLLRRRRITAAVVAIAVAVAATGLAVHAFDRAQGAVPALPPPRAGSIVFVGRGSAWAPTDNGSVYVYDPASGNVSKLLDLSCTQDAAGHRSCPGVRVNGVAASPDGTRFVYSLAESHPDTVSDTTWTMTDAVGLHVLDLRSGRSTRIVPCAPPSCSEIGSVAWSPNGTTIAYTIDRLDGASIRLVDPDGSNDRALDVGLADARDPAWSPDSSRIAFSAMPSHGPQVPTLFETAICCDTRELIFGHTQRSGYAPAWSPAGTSLAYVQGEGGPTGSVWVLRTESGIATRVESLGVAEQSTPAWSPDGSRIAVISNGRLLLVDPDGGTTTVLTKAWSRVGPVFYPGGSW